ncbi:hypothetical protein HN592_02390 [Candidatus Woesearchaeota archaeon]|jgi:hypothetical protein|nr:hypothetical protein [Candidatus Woesearchaeota archaeon]MBT4368060.1 hypothetical protein [Candidatus Woesearchaeota archaeon]MBT4712548.1 hypothetical protein [Candidatus Woesearchaeota archaeon]MBT6639461.1 hypothetical protein [Candidatus Woesearchaeota archaeon]MBT7133633.1 hypothetical protein [Candidatus Woesearchaeota archaeon]
MKLHALVYIVVGLAVTIISAFNDQLTLFVAVGIVFMFIGIIKFIGNKPVKELDTPRSPREVSSDNKYVKCSHCKAWNHPHIKFCHHCHRRI